MNWAPGASLKWLPVCKALAESKVYVIIGVMSVETPIRGRILPTEFSEQGFFEVETAVTRTNRETGEVLGVIPAVTMFHTDDIGWITKMPSDFEDDLPTELPSKGALTDDEKRALGLIE